MIDIHCHILPGVDDGPRALDESVALARSAADLGVETIVATPHIRSDYPFDPASVPDRVAELRAALATAGIPIELLAGGEVALSEIDLLDDAVLAGLCLGHGRYVLVESPYGHVGDLVENALFDLLARGYRPVLAHPERSPSFQGDVPRLAAIVDGGTVCSVTAGSMAGRFGRTVQRLTRTLIEEGLVHDVASDAHDTVRRPPGASGAFEAISGGLRGIDAHAGWYLREAPSAIVAGTDLPPRPPAPRPRRLFR